MSSLARRLRVSRRMLILLGVLVVEVGLLAAIYLRAGLATAGGYGFPLDDSWIHATFARNVGEGRGMVYNPGQPVSSTSILYSLVLGALYGISVAPLFNAFALGLVLHVAAAVFVYLSARELSADYWIAAGAAMLFAAIPRLVWGALSGMEVSLYVFLTAAGIFSHLRYRWHDGARAYLSTAIFALAALARPECGVFLAVAIADRALSSLFADQNKGGIRRFARTLPFHLLLAAAIIAPAVIFNIAATGLPLPPPFYAKTWRYTGYSLVHHLSIGLDVLPAYLRRAFWSCSNDNLVLGWLLYPGLLLCIDRARRRLSPGALLLPLMMLAVPTAVALCSRVGSSGLQMTGRYSAYLAPPFVVAAALAMDAGWRWIALQGRPHRIAAGVAAALVFGGAVAAVVPELKVGIWAYGWEVQNINAMQVTLGKWVDRHLPADAVIAMNDAGAIPYFSRRRMLDTEGVVDPEVVQYARKYPRSRSRGVLEFLRKHRPEYLIIFPGWYPDIAYRTDILEPIHYITLDYNLVCGGDTMIVYRTHWK